MIDKPNDNAVKNKETLMRKDAIRKSLVNKYDLLIFAHTIIAKNFANDGNKVLASKHAVLVAILIDICNAIESGELFN